MVEHAYDVAIVGAGIAGSSMAGALAEMGWHIVLIDKQTFPRHKVCGEFLSPESVKFLANLGLEKLIGSLHPSEMDKVRLTLDASACLEIPLPGTALGISRYVLDNALLQNAQKKGVDVQTGTKVTGIIPCEREFRLEVRNKQEQKTIKARAVIGAWGRNPQFSLSGYTGRTSRQSLIGVKSHYEGVKMEPVVELYFFPGGYLGVSPVEGNRINVAALLTRTAFHDAGKTVLKAIDSAARLNPALAERLANRRPVPGTQVAVASVSPSRKQVAWGLVPHIGDVAAVIPPLCGDGMAMALRTAELCASFAHRFLCGELSIDEWRKHYSTTLRREFSNPLRWGSLFQLLLGSSTISPLLFRLGQLAPGLAYRMVQVTRLKGSD